MGSLHVVHNKDMSEQTRDGWIRKMADVEDGHVTVVDGRHPAGTTSGWHTHGNRLVCVYVVEGDMRIEWGTGGREAVDLSGGDYYVMPPNTVHREGNPGATEQRVIAFAIGSGPSLVNMEAPE